VTSCAEQEHDWQWERSGSKDKMPGGIMFIGSNSTPDEKRTYYQVCHNCGDKRVKNGMNGEWKSAEGNPWFAGYKDAQNKPPAPVLPRKL